MIEKMLKNLSCGGFYRFEILAVLSKYRKNV